LGPDSSRPGLGRRRQALVRGDWRWVRQVHGAGVVVVEGPGQGRGEEADALVTRLAGTPLAVFSADCAAVALSSPEGVAGAAHAGWRGVLAGVLEQAVEAMGVLGATRVEAAVGPCIHPECYEFSPADLDRVAARLGGEVVATTAWGSPALDLPAAVAASLRRAGAGVASLDARCTACDPELFSHRARREAERQALVVWRD